MDDPFALLSEAELDWLDNFLLFRIEENADTEGKDEGVLGISELDGMFTAIVSGPKALLPSDWLPVVWGDFVPEWVDEAELSKVMSLLLRHMNEIAGTLHESPEDFEPIFLERMVDGKSYTIVDEWCRGYMRGVSLCMDLWDEGGEDIMQMLMPIILFTSQKGWEMLDEMSDEEVETMQAAIPVCAQDIYTWWLDQREEEADWHPDVEYADLGFPETVNSPLQKQPNVGRNDPCPCGSGKKFKKCCLH